MIKVTFSFSCKSIKSFKTSVDALESREPVGSSARIIDG
jgi:hypothetical protein